MSSRVWNTVQQRHDARNMVAAGCILFAAQEIAGDNDEDDDDNEDDDDDDAIEIQMLSTVQELVQTFSHIENPDIQFGRRMLISELNQADCLAYFNLDQPQQLQTIGL
jgi:hypothetical protein